MQNSNSSIHVYPNPAQDKFAVELSGEKSDVIISDLMSRKIFSVKNVSGMLQVDSRNFPAGIYVVNVFSGSGKVMTQKISVVP